jgi:6-phosphofructokinase 1
LAGGGDLILLPELKYDEDCIVNFLEDRAIKNKPYTIVVVAEGVLPDRKKRSAAKYISDLISKRTGLETRETVLGYVQRGGSPSPADRILATRFGAYAAELIALKRYGTMVAIKNNSIIDVPLSEVAGIQRLVTIDDPVLHQAKGLGTSFGCGI